MDDYFDSRYMTIVDVNQHDVHNSARVGVDRIGSNPGA